MIKVENVDIWGWNHAIRGMRNPLNSWNKSDSTEYKIGKTDMQLMQKLFASGTEHRKYLRQIFVSMDITAPLYWWKEFDTYKVGTTSNSCSTMHKIADHDFTIHDFSVEHLTKSSYVCLQVVIDELNRNRMRYLLTKDKDYWWNMIQLLPSSYNQKRTITMDYENVFNMIKQRENHKLDEWVEFRKLLLDFPYVKNINRIDEY